MAVDGVSFEVAAGELLVLFGPSGCGKTTLLRLAAGLDTPSQGTIRIDGRAMNGRPPKDHQVAMVFQHDVLYPHLDVRKNLGFALNLRGVPAAEIARRVAEAAKLLGIAGLLSRYPEELSGGQRQRVALGRAMVRRAEVFLLDEPLSRLDAPLRQELRHEVRRLHDHLGAATIYVTHDQAEALTLGDRIAVIRQGRLQQVADPLTLYRHPVNRFVAGLIGNPAMNFLHGSLEARDGSGVFTADGFSCPLLPEHAGRLHGHLGKPLFLGLRPEHIHSQPTPAVSVPRVRAAIETVETTGADAYLSFRIGGSTLTARADGHSDYRRGEVVEFSLELQQAQFFDGETQQAIAMDDDRRA